MGYKPKKWPTYALASLEDALALTQRIDKNVQEAQAAIVGSNSLLAVLALSDIRQHNQEIREDLVRARAGDYTNEGAQ